MLQEANLPTTFVRVAAPTGTAAFNIRYSATTIHRLIHWFNPRFFEKITDDKKLFALQEHFRHTRLILIDEVSMVGRRMMGRIATRLEEAAPIKSPYVHSHDMGGLSAVCVGDPAPCEAIFDDQMYDHTPHKSTVDHADAARLCFKKRATA